MKKTILILIMCFLVAITIILTIYVKQPKISSTMTYQESGNLNYSVCLMTNEYINESCLSENRSYISSLINNIIIDLDYQLSSSKVATYSYNYEIEAKVLAFEKGDTSKVLYNDSSVIKKYESEDIVDNHIKIEDNIDIDYQAYNEKMKSFKKNYVLSLDSNLTITVYLTINGVTEGIDEAIEENYTMDVKIPLTEQTTNLEVNNNVISNDKQIKQVLTKKYDIYDLILDVLYKVDIIYIGYLIYLKIKIANSEKKYNKIKRKILKTYDAYIVRSKQLPSFEHLKVIEVLTFEDLLDARDNLEKPIIFYENEKRNYATFAIINDNEAYMYILYGENEKTVKKGSKS